MAKSAGGGGRSGRSRSAFTQGRNETPQDFRTRLQGQKREIAQRMLQNEITSSSQVKPGDVVLSRNGKVGRVETITKAGVIVTRPMFVKPDFARNNLQRITKRDLGMGLFFNGSRSDVTNAMLMSRAYERSFKFGTKNQNK